MDIQAHSRTQQIKKLSRLLFMVLTGFRYLLFLGWPALIVVAFLPTGSLHIGDAVIPIETASLPLKGFVLALYACGLIIMLKLNHHFRELMKQYTSGNIFGREAIAQVRGALTSGIGFFILSWVQAIFACLYRYSLNASIDLSFTTEILIACIYFGLMYTLLWALEIGSDLNEESEMTI